MRQSKQSSAGKSVKQIWTKLAQMVKSKSWVKGLFVTVGFSLVGVLVLYLNLQILLSPNLASLVRHGFSAWLVIAGVVLFLVFLVKGFKGTLVSFIFVVFLFALPLSALYQEGYGEMQILGGLVSFSDSAGYYHEASRLLEGFRMTSFGARHIFAPALLATLLSLSGENLMKVLGTFTLSNAVGVFLAARYLRKSHNAVLASLFVLISFLFFRRFIGMTDTENLGFFLGMLGFTLLFTGGVKLNKPLIFSGVLLTAFALNARPGAFFILPCIIIWFIFTFKPQEKRRKAIDMAALMAMILLPFLINSFLAGVLSSGDNGLFSNYAYSLYGIIDGGTGWEQVYKDYPEITRMSERDSSRFVYRLAFENIRQNPEQTLIGIKNAYTDFFSLMDRSAYGFVSGGDVAAFDVPAAENRLTYSLTRFIFWVFSLSGIIWLFVKRKNSENSLVLWCLLGVCLSVPFIPPRDAAIMRVHAATMAYLNLLPALGVMWFFADWGDSEDERHDFEAITFQVKFFSILVLLLIVVSPLILLAVKEPAELPGFSCQSGQVGSAVRVRPGSYLFLRRNVELSQTRLPQIRQDDFVHSLERFPFASVVRELKTLSPPKVIMNALDLYQGNLLWAVLPPEAVDVIDAPLGVCGYWMPELAENGLGFLYVESFYLLE